MFKEEDFDHAVGWFERKLRDASSEHFIDSSQIPFGEVIKRYEFDALVSIKDAFLEMIEPCVTEITDDDEANQKLSNVMIYWDVVLFQRVTKYLLEKRGHKITDELMLDALPAFALIMKEKDDYIFGNLIDAVDELEKTLYSAKEQRETLQ